MFIFRSIFWLTVAYLVIKPGLDINDAATSLSTHAIAAGQQIVAEQVEQIQCDSLPCVGGKAVLSAALNAAPQVTSAQISSPQVGLPMHEQPTSSTVPYPRPRPDWAG